MGKVYMGGGAGGGSYTAGAGIDITSNVISATGGQSTPFRTIKRSLTSAQILNSNVSPIQLIAAQGAGTAIRLIAITANLIYNGITYATNIDGGIYVGSIQKVSDIVLNYTTTGVRYIGIDIPIPSTDFENEAVLFKTASGNPTDGDGTIDLYLSYIVITL